MSISPRGVFSVFFTNTRTITTRLPTAVTYTCQPRPHVFRQRLYFRIDGVV
jgi:hypothetical protein